jgi:hypothetical protein
VYCAHCGTKNQDEIESCDRCGESLVAMDPSRATQLGIKTCPDCQTVNDPRARFCTECGRDVDDIIATSATARQPRPMAPSVPIATRRSPVSPAPPPASKSGASGTPETRGDAGQVQRPALGPARPSVATDGVRADRGREDLRADADTPVQAPNNSGTPEAQLPEELKGWNLGALLLPFVWGPAHRVWIGLAVLLIFIPNMGALVLFVYGPAAIYVGMRGNEMAWRARKWESVAHFRSVQGQWAKWSAVGFALLAISFLIMLSSGSA